MTGSKQTSLEGHTGDQYVQEICKDTDKLCYGNSICLKTQTKLRGCVATHNHELSAVTVMNIKSGDC